MAVVEENSEAILTDQLIVFDQKLSSLLNSQETNYCKAFIFQK